MLDLGKTQTGRIILSHKRGPTLEGDRVQVVKDDFLVLLVDLLLLTEDNVALTLNGALLELAVLENITDDLDSLGDILPEALGVVHRLLAGGIGVEVRAKVLDFELKRLLRALASTLEREMLEEVGGTRSGIRLCARAGVDPHAHGRRLCAGVRLGRDSQPIRERRYLSNRRRARRASVRRKGALGVLFVKSRVLFAGTKEIAKIAGKRRGDGGGPWRAAGACAGGPG